jgi:hypothetical protein
MFIKKSLILALSVSAIMSFFTACKKDKDETNPPGTTHFEMRMTDAPSAYSAVNVDIQAVEVKTDNGATTNLNTSAGVYNLLDFANGVDTMLAYGDLTTSTVSQIRLILGSNNTVVVNGNTYPLSTPSAQQSGLKLNVHTQLVAGVTYRMLIDFDANQSVVEEGNGSYSLKPVIHVVTAVAQSGSIHGMVMPAAALPAAIIAVQGNDTVSTNTDANGYFLLQGTAAGTWTVIVRPQAPYHEQTISNVSVSLGVMTEMNMITVI